MNTRKSGILGLAFFLGMILSPQVSQANDLKVTNVRLGPRDTSAKTLSVLFDISWQNSWRNKINHDAAWVTVRLADVNAASLEKKLCSLSVSGSDPAGTAYGSGNDLEVYVPSDKIGAFIRRSVNHPTEDISTAGAMLTINYEACGLSEASQVTATVIALEMVFIPEGSFFAGDHAASAAVFQRGAADNAPWPITSESAINVTATTGNGYYYVSAGNPGEMSSGSSFAVPAVFPKGFNGFYMMKYELTEGEWVEFVNSLPALARPHRDVTDIAHKNSDAVTVRNTILCSGSPLLCASERPFRAMSYLSWPDLAAFLDWAGLRPMTELEFEKSARGPFVPVNGEYAWGTTRITAAAAISGSSEDGTELVTTSNANVHHNNILLSGGDSVNGPEYQQGPLRAGIFATDLSGREASGAGNYGAMDLSGNVKEWVISVGNSAGLGYAGAHGDGYLTSASGFEGNADASGWPGMGADAARGVLTAAGVGFRGGSWMDPSVRLSISDRMEAASAISDAASTYGGRGVRSAENQ
jgi:formylglycine-generating enzyme required for sulfatase activity